MAQLTLTVPDALVPEIVAACWPDGKPVAGEPPVPISNAAAMKLWIVSRVREAVSAARYERAIAAAATAENPDLDGIG